MDAVSKTLLSAFDAQREFLKVVATTAKPSDSKLQELIKPTSAKMMAVNEFCEKNNRSKDINFIKAISESVMMLGWVMQAPKPAPFVTETLGSTQFWSNVRTLQQIQMYCVCVIVDPLSCGSS